MGDKELSEMLKFIKEKNGRIIFSRDLDYNSLTTIEIGGYKSCNYKLSDSFREIKNRMETKESDKCNSVKSKSK